MGRIWVEAGFFSRIKWLIDAWLAAGKKWRLCGLAQLSEDIVWNQSATGAVYSTSVGFWISEEKSEEDFSKLIGIFRVRIESGGGRCGDFLSLMYFAGFCPLLIGFREGNPPF